MTSAQETDQELLARCHRVQDELAKRKARMEQTPFGSKRDGRARFCGSLMFALLQIESTMRERGLLDL